MSTSGLTEFFHHNLWANLRLLDSCSQLTEAQLDATTAGIYGSIRETLMHLFGAEEGYARRFDYNSELPQPPLRESDEFVGIDELKRRAEISGKVLIAASEQADIREVLHLDNGTYDAQVIIVLLQAINHGVDHRSQIATIMSQQGVTPPTMDAWGYNDEVYLSE